MKTWMRRKRRTVTTKRAIPVILACLLCSHLLLAAKDQTKQKHYGLIFGTAYGPDDRPLYGAKIQIHPAGKKHPRWELVSDHRGEFAQRVPPGPADYVVSGAAEIAPAPNGSPQAHKKKRIKSEATVHIEKEERQDISLHLSE